jgi:hypothetical protein
MRADAYPLDTVLGEKQQWVVPVYQRHYEWETGKTSSFPSSGAIWRTRQLTALRGAAHFRIISARSYFQNRKVRPLVPYDVGSSWTASMHQVR